MRKTTIYFVFLLSSWNILAQDIQINDSNYVSKDLYDWWQKDFESTGILGISLDQAYSLLKNKKSKEIIVGVIDSGVDIFHPDIKDNIWENKGEIAGNGIDDDQNGYIDDINGWNFLVDKENKSIDYETLELVRIVRGDYDNIPTSEIEKAKTEYSEKKKEISGDMKTIKVIMENFVFCKQYMKDFTGKETYNSKDLELKSEDSEQTKNVKSFLTSLEKDELSEKVLAEWEKQTQSSYQYHYNLNFNPRGDFSYFENTPGYGNSNVYSNGADHGTHVAGIIAAVRNNNLGINGVVDNVKIMPLRVVPNGDERDLDVANAIIYAVDNGAKIINMSFGKNYSVDEQKVISAIKYAQENEVLIIHAAGNTADNIDENIHYPSNRINDSDRFDNWICVGASDMKKNKEVVAVFSNYGEGSVNVFAPGTQIYSLLPKNNYELMDGTSMAAPVVTGVAALIMSYYPQLNYKEIKEIIYQSSFKLDKQKVFLPDLTSSKKKKTKFKKLSSPGGIVNAYNAIQLADLK